MRSKMTLRQRCEMLERENVVLRKALAKTADAWSDFGHNVMVDVDGKSVEIGEYVAMLRMDGSDPE